MEENYDGFLKELSCLEYRMNRVIILLENAIPMCHPVWGVGELHVRLRFRECINRESTPTPLYVPLINLRTLYRHTALNADILKFVLVLNITLFQIYFDLSENTTISNVPASQADFYLPTNNFIGGGCMDRTAFLAGERAFTRRLACRKRFVTVPLRCT